MCALRRVAAWMHAASSSTSGSRSSQAGTAGPRGRAHGIGSRSRSGVRTPTRRLGRPCALNSARQCLSGPETQIGARGPRLPVPRWCERPMRRSGASRRPRGQRAGPWRTGRAFRRLPPARRLHIDNGGPGRCERLRGADPERMPRNAALDPGIRRTARDDAPERAVRYALVPHNRAPPHAPEHRPPPGGRPHLAKPARAARSASL